MSNVIPFPSDAPVADRVGDLSDFVRELAARGFDVGTSTPDTADEQTPDTEGDVR